MRDLFVVVYVEIFEMLVLLSAEVNCKQMPVVRSVRKHVTGTVLRVFSYATIRFPACTPILFLIRSDFLTLVVYMRVLLLMLITIKLPHSPTRNNSEGTILVIKEPPVSKLLPTALHSSNSSTRGYNFFRGTATDVHVNPQRQPAMFPHVNTTSACSYHHFIFSS